MRALKVESPCPRVEERSGNSFDADLIGIGGGPWKGDMASVGVKVPEAPTTLQENAYLFRLAGVAVDRDHAVIVRGLRTLVTISGEFSPSAGNTVKRELVVTSAYWRFSDTSAVVFGLRWQQKYQHRRVVDPQQQPGTSPDLNRLDVGLLYAELSPNYVAPNAGIPPGSQVGGLGDFRDNRFPWQDTQTDHSIWLPGPGTAVLYASVYQTDSARRVALPAFGTAQYDALGPEDKFTSAYASTVKYERVAGAILYEVLPCCAEDRPPPSKLKPRKDELR